MKSIKLNLNILLLAVIVVLTAVACKEKNTVTPAVEEEFAPVKVELTLVEGHLHGTYKFHQSAEVATMKHLKSTQKMTYVATKSGWQLDSGSVTSFKVKSNYVVYGLLIKYFDQDGKDITASFVENGADKKHQHFFTPTDVKPTFDGVVEADDSNIDAIFGYRYCDTDPWNKSFQQQGAKLIGDKNPIGLKGFFTFKKSRKMFNLHIELMHALHDKFINGEAAPFNKPTAVQRQQNHWDFSLKVPVVVYADQEEVVETEFESREEVLAVTEDVLTEAERKYLQSIAKAYGITWQEALLDIYERLSGDLDPESGELYF